MRRKFEIICTVQIHHEEWLKYLPDDWATNAGYTPEQRAEIYSAIVPDVFSFSPLPDTEVILSNLGIVFKQGKNNAFCAIEKRFDEANQVFVLSRPFTTAQALSFHIRMKDKTLISHTYPFTLKGADGELPYYSGLQRLMYFDNIADDGSVLSSGRLTKDNEVGKSDAASLITNRHVIFPRFPGTEKVQIGKISPGLPPPVVEEFPIKDRVVEISLASGAYQFTHLPGNNTEVVFAESLLAGEDILGICTIFIEPGMLDGTIHDYVINFDNRTIL